MGWRKQDVAEIVLLVTKRQKEEMGRRVARARDIKGMTNESLARKSGLSIKTVSRFVNGKHEPREHTIKSLARALGISVEEIRGTPPAPLGLGAREDQVETGFEEFRDHVDDLKSHLDVIERKLDRNMEATARLLEAMDGLTGEQVAEAMEQASAVEGPAVRSRRTGTEGRRSATRG